MSRLFSQLENIGHDRTDVERPAAQEQAGTADVAPAPAQAGQQNLSAAPPPLTESPAQSNFRPASATVRSQMPGYAIASQLALSDRPQPPAPPSRATWPVRLWFLSLLALIGLSLAMLLWPRDDTTVAQHPAPRPAATAPEPTGDDALLPPPAVPAAPSASATAGATAQTKAAPAAAPVARPADQPVARRQPSQPSTDQPATPARAPAGDAGCSAAMAAMNLCSASPP